MRKYLQNSRSRELSEAAVLNYASTLKCLLLYPLPLSVRHSPPLARKEELVCATTDEKGNWCHSRWKGQLGGTNNGKSNWGFMQALKRLSIKGEKLFYFFRNLWMAFSNDSDGSMML